MTREEIAAKKAKSQARAVRRAERVAENAALAGERVLAKRPRPIKRGIIKKQIVRLLGLKDRKLNGSQCRIIPECPDKTPHEGDCAYHVWPSGAGDNIRLNPLAVVWACSAANYGEHRNRLLYRDKHEKIFGKERMEYLRQASYIKKQYGMAELREMRETLKWEVEGE